jgi:hypothetical protein
LKREAIELMRCSPGAKKETLVELGLTSPTYYRWQQRIGDVGPRSRHCWRNKNEAGKTSTAAAQNGQNEPHY